MEKNKQHSLQTILFQNVQASIPVHRSLVDELSELLEISTDSVYRRLRNETMLSIDEVQIICNNYSISFDSISNNEMQTVVCNHAALRNEQDLTNHLLYMNKELEFILSVPDSHITYAAIDIPIFHHFQFQELSSFKIFYWLRSVINDADFNSKKYNPKLISDELMTHYKKMFETYKNCNLTEIWTDSTIRSLIKQIEFFWQSGMFETRDEALLICDQAEQEILLIQSMADVPIQNQNDKQYKLYFSEIEIGNNSILVKLGNQKRSYLSYNTLNLLVTSHQGFCDEIEIWQQNFIGKATLISGASEKIRYQFFRRLLDDIAALKKRIEA